ncbi:unnamed protein product [Closterium sp. NIES-53]
MQAKIAAQFTQTLQWHHRLGHPSLPRLRGMHSPLLVSGLTRSLPPLPPSSAPPCIPCVKGRRRAAPHSSSIPPTIAPLQNFHMDVWGPARLREWFRADLPVLCLHSDRGGEFSSDLLRDFCRGEGILQSFTLLAFPQQNRIAEQRIGLVKEVARTSMMHAAAPHFLWLFAVRYAAHQLNLWPRVSFPETLPTQRWTGKVGDTSVFRVWGSYPLCGPAPVEVAVGSGVARGAASGGEEPGVAESDGAGCGGAELWGEELGGAEPAGVLLVLRRACLRSCCVSGLFGTHAFVVELPELEALELRTGGAGVTAGAGCTGGTAATGPGGARTRGTGAAGTGGVGGAGAGDPTKPGAAGAGGSGAGGAGAGGATAGGTDAGGAGAGGTGAGVAGAGGPGAIDPGGNVRPQPYFVPLLQQVLGVPSSTSLTPPLLCPPPDQSQLPLLPASPVPAPSPYTEQSGGLIDRRQHSSRPISPFRTARRVPRSCPPPVPRTHAMALRPSSVPLRVPLPAPPESSLPVVHDLESDLARATSPTVSRLLATAITDPSFESAAASALVAELLDFAAACRLDYATALVAESASASPPSVGGECALGTDVLEDRQEDFECLAAAVPRFASMLLAPEGDPDAPDILPLRSYAEAIMGPYSSQWQAAMDTEMASWKSTGTYVDEVPPPGTNIVDCMWIFRVKRPPVSPPAVKARYVARGFSQRQGVNYFQTFSPTPKMTNLRPARGDLAAPPTWLHWVVSCRYPVEPRRPVYGLRQAPREWNDTLRTTLAALGFAPSTADPLLFIRTDTSLPPFYVLVYITWDRARRTITLTQSHMVHQVLQRFGFQFSSPQPTPLSTSHSLSAPPSDESVEPSGPYPELVGCLMYLMTCTRPDLAYPLSLLI